MSRFHDLLISDLVFTDTQLGVGSDATVYEVNWRGTVCAAKRLHDILLQDQSPGGAEKLISNFETECLTWSKLRHPRVVQFLGVYLEPNSRLPVPVIEKMGTSLRKYCESHSKEEFPLHLKAFVLRQICQAIAYLHGQNPPLVHHDLSPNNVLLNVVSFVTKLTDFGMSRAINPSSIIRKSSKKGTLAFMSPEALQNPPRYNEKLDVFSFGSIILFILTHEWPEPDPSTQFKGDQLIALNELQRRERYVEMFTAQEKQLFLPTVCQCLENQPDKRPSSAVLVRELRHIESSLPSGSHVAAPIEQVHQQLSTKEEECRQKDKALREKDEALRETDEALMVKDEALKEKDEALREKDDELREKDEELIEKDKALREKDDELREKDEELIEKDEALREKDKTLMEKEEALREKDDAVKEKDETLREKNKALEEKEEELKEKDKGLKEYDDALKEKGEALKEKDKALQMALRETDEVLRENRELLETVQEKQASDQAQHATIEAQQDTIQVQQDTIKEQQAEIEQLRKQPAVAKQVSCHISS